MGAEAPQWLYSSFVDSMRQIGATASDGDLMAEARGLVERWSEPIRHLHNIHHLIDVLAHVDELSSTTHDPDLLRVAAWYHGALLNTAVEASFTGMDPSTIAGRCAEFTSQRLAALGVDADTRERVAELIRDAAAHTAPRDDVDAQVLVDADLATLAGSPQAYKKYRQMLREEYTDHDDLAFLRARRRVVHRLLARPTLFQSPGGQAWEPRARENLEAELAKIEDAIARLDPGDPEATAAQSPDSEVDVVSGPVRAELTPEEAMTPAGTLIIRRRHVLKKHPRDTGESSGNQDDRREAHTDADRGVDPESRRLPDLRAEEAPGQHQSDDEEDASSLETAIDALDVPSRHLES